MLITKIKAGESALKDDGIGNIHVAMLADDQFRVYVEGGMLPDGEDEAIFENMHDALVFAFEVAAALVEEFLKEQGVDT